MSAPHHVGVRAVAERLAQCRCPEEECEGRIGDGVSSVHPSADDRIPFGHIGCSGSPMHVWEMKSLWDLQPNLVKTVET